MQQTLLLPMADRRVPTPPFIRWGCSGPIPFGSPLLVAFFWEEDDTFFRFQDLRTPHLLLFDDDVWWRFTVVSSGSHNSALLVAMCCSLASFCWSARKRHVSRMLSRRHTSNSWASCCWLPSNIGFTSLQEHRKKHLGQHRQSHAAVYTRAGKNCTYSSLKTRDGGEWLSPESMEEYIWLERITVLLNLCWMQRLIEVMQSLSSNLYPWLALQWVARVRKGQQILAAPALTTTGARHITSQWWRLYLQ